MTDHPAKDSPSIKELLALLQDEWREAMITTPRHHKQEAARRALLLQGEMVCDDRPGHVCIQIPWPRKWTHEALPEGTVLWNAIAQVVQNIAILDVGTERSITVIPMLWLNMGYVLWTNRLTAMRRQEEAMLAFPLTPRRSRMRS